MHTTMTALEAWKWRLASQKVRCATLGTLVGHTSNRGDRKWNGRTDGACK